MSPLCKYNNSIRPGMSSWLASHEWDLFTTYTFEEHFSYNSAKKAIERHYERMCKEFKVKYPFFYIIEPHSDYNQSGTHIHGLVGPPVGDIQLSGKRMDTDWQDHEGHGFVNFRKYKEDHGVDYYLTKYLVKSRYDDSYWDIYNLNDD